MNVLKCASYEIISTIIVTDIYVHSLVELKIKKNNLQLQFEVILTSMQ